MLIIDVLMLQIMPMIIEIIKQKENTNQQTLICNVPVLPNILINIPVRYDLITIFEALTNN